MPWLVLNHSFARATACSSSSLISSSSNSGSTIVESNPTKAEICASGKQSINSWARRRAHELIDCLPDAQISALVGLLSTIVDPEFEDEEISEEEEQAVARAKEWFKTNQGIPFEDVVAELGFTMEQVRNYKDPD